MDQAFDPLNIILLAVAVIVFVRLRSVLGTRTGNERRRDPFSSGPDTASSSPAKGPDNVIPMPGQQKSKSDSPPEVPQTPVWKGFASEGSELAENLTAIRQADTSFNPAEFLAGAKVAYEMIVTAYAQGDKKALKNLLSKDVYAGFSTAIDERKARGEAVETRFVGIDEASIVDASLRGRIANLTIRFVSQLISVTRDREDNVIDGDPSQIGEVTDVWTFERDTASRDPNWKLSATEATG